MAEQWNLVTESTPHEHEHVLAWDSRSGVMAICYRVGDTWYTYGAYRPVTHWRPLPKEPDHG